jgi:hypothetical protein
MEEQDSVAGASGIPSGGIGRAMFRLLKIMLLVYFYPACVFFGFFAVALGALLLLTNTGVLNAAAQSGNPIFPKADFFAALLLVVSNAWIVTTALADGKRWSRIVSWVFIVGIAVVSACLMLSGLFADGRWVDHEPSRAGSLWFCLSFALAGLLLVTRLRRDDWALLQRLWSYCDRHSGQVSISAGQD